MVGVAQLVEHPVVVRVVAGSIPVAHPNFLKENSESTNLEFSDLGISPRFAPKRSSQDASPKVDTHVLPQFVVLHMYTNKSVVAATRLQHHHHLFVN